MKFIINETGEHKELQYIDPKTGVDCINDITGNTYDFATYTVYDQEINAYHISQNDYNWWDEYITHAQEDAEELARLRKELDQRDEYTGQSTIDSIISRYYTPIDMEGEHDEWKRVFEIIKKKLETDD